MTSVTSTANRTPERSEALERWLRRLTVTILVLLWAQFIVGMLANFFVTLPDQHPGTNAPEYFFGVAATVWWALGRSGLILASHAGLGVILGALSLALLILALLARRRAWIIATICGWLTVWAAGFNGASFMNYGHDVSSLIMAIAFMLAICAYALGMYYTKAA